MRQHHQVIRNGVSMDEGIADLVTTVWSIGFDTVYSCEGDPSLYPGWGDGEGSAMLAFKGGVLQAATFVQGYLDSTHSRLWPHSARSCAWCDTPQQHGEFVITAGEFFAQDIGFVYFPPAYIPVLTRAWENGERVPLDRAQPALGARDRQRTQRDAACGLT